VSHLPVCRCQAEPHDQIQKCVDGIGDETVKSDRSAVVLHHFGLGRTKQLSQTLLVETTQSPC